MKTETPQTENVPAVVQPPLVRPLDFKPSPRWHMGLQEWVLTTEPQTKSEIIVRRWNGIEHLAMTHMLYISEPNVQGEARAESATQPDQKGN